MTATANTGSANLGAAFSNSVNMLNAAAQVQLAVGIIAEFINKLDTGPFAQPMLPSTVNIWAGVPGGCVLPKASPLPQPAAPQWSASMTGANTASVNLGDGYRLQIDERNSEMTIFNDKTGERTRIWGDPHVEIDGKQAFDFWGTTTFTLANGTKLTINTEQWNGNPNMYVASQVVITRGSNAITIDGISQNKIGDLSLTLGQNGSALDAAHRDGLTLTENNNGAGWLNEAGRVATQADGDLTRPGAIYGPGSEMPSWAELTNQLSFFLFYGIIADAASAEPARGGGRNDRVLDARLGLALLRSMNA